MTVDQIYTLVNSAASQAFGSSVLQVNDAQSLVALGNTVLSSTTNTELFLNTLIQRVGRTIYSFRAYRNKFADYYKSDMEYGAIVQKVKAKMATAEADESYGLTDGVAVDMYKVRKPEVEQKLFVKETPYQIAVTIQRALLKRAFLSPAGVEELISIIFGEIQNSIEFNNENLGKVTLCNLIAEQANTARTINLLTNYKAASGDSAITAQTALFDEAFLRYATAQINLYSDYLTDMRTEFNGDGYERHTPKEDQFLRVITQFENALESQMLYGAYNEGYVKLPEFKQISFWQSSTSPFAIQVERASDGEETALNNVVAVLHDRDACGVYSVEEDVLTTPVNAAGRYYNTFWHLRNLWFNDLSENCVVFTLN